jgi:2-methylcitrate dehydratase
VAPVLAAAEYAGQAGRDFLAALAVAYQVQCRLSDVAPVRDRGFDHTTQSAYAVAGGVSRALELDPVRTVHAVAISGTSVNALRVSRTGPRAERRIFFRGRERPSIHFGSDTV